MSALTAGVDLVKLGQQLKTDKGIHTTLHPFGRTNRVFIKVKKDDLSVSMEWFFQKGFNQLDQLSVFDSFKTLTLSYFLRSSKTNEEILVRLEEEYKEPFEIIRISSVDSVWPIAGVFEKANSIDFGICFEKKEENSSGLESLDPPFLRRKANFS